MPASNSSPVSTFIFVNFALEIKIQLILSILTLFITFHNALVFVDSTCCISVVIQNFAHVHMNFCITGTDSVTSQIFTFSTKSPCIGVYIYIYIYIMYTDYRFVLSGVSVLPSLDV